MTDALLNSREGDTWSISAGEMSFSVGSHESLQYTKNKIAAVSKVEKYISALLFYFAKTAP